MIPDYIQQYHDYIKKYPIRIPESISQRVRIDKEMLELFTYEIELVHNIIQFIEHNVILVDGQNRVPIKLTLPQKYQLAVIFGFWGNIEEPNFDESGTQIGTKTTYQRIVKDATIMVASGFGKTTLLSALNTFILESGMFADPKIFIGSNSQKQSKLCFKTTMKMLQANEDFADNYNYRESINELENVLNNGMVVAMSSEGTNYEGINPVLIILDEAHGFKTSEYAHNLKKSTKRTDSLNLTITTQGTERGGYLDKQLELARKLLSGNEVNYRTQFFIYEQESIEEIVEAYETDNYEILFKSNPNIGVSQSPKDVMDKIKEMLEDESKKVTTLTKNFNIPQNPESSLFTNDECQANDFDEVEILSNSVGFFGFDMALQMTPDTDFTALTYMVANPNTEELHFKDWYFVPKWHRDKRTGELKEHLPLKAKVDNVDYMFYKNNGDIIELECEYITEEIIYQFIIDFIQDYNITALKFGIDPAYCSKLITQLNDDAGDKMFTLFYKSDQKKYNTPIINEVKSRRAKKKVYCNNKLTERQFATVQQKQDANGNILLTNRKRDRKDGVIAHMAAYSAYDVFITNKRDGTENLRDMKELFEQEAEKKLAREKVSRETTEENEEKITYVW